MSAALTPFQMWTLFTMLEYPSNSYNSKELLLRCCDSAIMALPEGAEDGELSKLESTGYIEIGPLDSLLDRVSTTYSISNKGIHYVRRNLSSIQEACNQGKVPESVIEAQDDEVAEALRAKSPHLSNLIKEHGIKNIGPILKLIEACIHIGG